MFDPISYWTRTLAGWRTIGETAERMGTTAQASQSVIASRTATMGEAMRSPATGDYAELARMVPEKVAAFSESGSAVVGAWWAMQADYVAEAQHVSAMMLRGRAPTIGEATELSSRLSMYGLRAFEATSRVGRDALAPVHKSATANARRIGGKR